MSYNAVEQSQYLASLTEYFRFAVGETVYRFNGSAETLELATGTDDQNGNYSPAVISLSGLEHVRDLGDFTVQIVVARDNPVAELFRTYVPDPGVQVWVFRKHESDDEVTTWFAGDVLDCNWKESEAVLVCQPNIGKMKRLGLWMRWQPTCNLQVYSARCGVDPADFTASVAVTAIDGLTITVSGMAAVADRYYNGGYVTDADSSRRHIELHAGAELTLLLDLDGLEIGHTVSITAGCDGQHTTCRTKFFPAGGEFVDGIGNILNHLGFFTTPDRNIFTQGLGAGTPGTSGDGSPSVFAQFTGGG